MQELISLCSGVVKELKGAVTAAAKRMQQQSAEQDSKKRKVSAASGQTQDVLKPVKIFEFLPGWAGEAKDKLSDIKLGKVDEDNDVSVPCLINVKQDMQDWPPVLASLQKIMADFRVEFEASPFAARSAELKAPTRDGVQQGNTDGQNVNRAAVFR